MIWPYGLSKKYLKMLLKIIMLLLIYDINLVQTSNWYFHGEDFYVLVYTNPERTPFLYATTEEQYVVKKNCRFQNCHFIKNKTYYDDIKKYDALLFHVADLPHIELPKERSHEQRYIFVSDEPATLYKVTSKYDNVFNFTWTYKLNSDATLRSLIVKTKKNNEIIGPVKELDKSDGTVHWIDINDESEPVSDEIQIKLQNKSKAAAWFPSECQTSSKREDYVKKLITELKNYNLTVDIYGKCGNLKCPQDSLKECQKLLQSDYFFYLAFESSKSEDYVTEELLIPLKNFAVPVVYGGANYDRFMPRGMYLDASMQPKDLASSMNDYITNRDKYYDLFKWHKTYSFHYPNETADTDEICKFCAFLNDHKQFFKTTVYTFIDKFWTPE